MSKVVSMADYRRRREADEIVRMLRERPKHLTHGTPEQRREHAERAAQADEIEPEIA